MAIGHRALKHAMSKTFYLRRINRRLESITDRPRDITGTSYILHLGKLQPEECQSKPFGHPPNPRKPLQQANKPVHVLEIENQGKTVCKCIRRNNTPKAITLCSKDEYPRDSPGLKSHSRKIGAWPEFFFGNPVTQTLDRAKGQKP